MINFLINVCLSLATFFAFRKSRLNKKEAKELKEELEKSTRQRTYLEQQNANYIRRLYPNKTFIKIDCIDKTPIEVDCIVCENPFVTRDINICKSCNDKIQRLQHSEPTKN